MKKEYDDIITEVLQRTVQAKAPNKEEAEYVVKQQYYNQEHILNENDLIVQSVKVKKA